MSIVKKKEGNLIFTIDGFSVYKDSVYIITNKTDLDAPNGFREEGVSKIPGTPDTFQCPFKSNTPGTPAGVWDTGFSEYSPCYAHMDVKVRKEMAMNLTKQVLEPFKITQGVKSEMDTGDDSFWLNWLETVKEDDVLRSNSPKDLMTIYLGLRSKKLTPKGEESNSSYTHSSFVISDISSNQKASEVKGVDKMQASALFYTMCTNDLTKAKTILYYMGMNISNTVEPNVLLSMFSQSVVENTEKVKEFLSIWEKSNTREGYDEISIFETLKKESVKSKTKVLYNGGKIYYEDTELGLDFKTAAAKLALAEDGGKLQEIKNKILLGTN